MLPIVLLALFVTLKACAPGQNPQPATMTFYTNQPYVESQNAHYVSFAKTQLQQMLKRYNIAYSEGMFTVIAQSANGKVAVVVHVPKVDCNSVPLMAREVKKSFSVFSITSATAQCGNGDATYV